jgi:hypothetical protein
MDREGGIPEQVGSQFCGSFTHFHLDGEQQANIMAYREPSSL